MHVGQASPIEETNEGKNKEKSEDITSHAKSLLLKHQCDKRIRLSKGKKSHHSIKKEPKIKQRRLRIVQH